MHRATYDAQVDYVIVPTIPQATPPVLTATFAAGCFWGTEKFFVEEFRPYIRDIAVGTPFIMARLHGRK